MSVRGPGTSLSVVIGVSVEVAILVSAGVSILYTMVGQMIAVAYTDVFQLICITVGLVRSRLKRYLISVPSFCSSHCVRVCVCE